MVLLDKEGGLYGFSITNRLPLPRPQKKKPLLVSSKAYTCLSTKMNLSILNKMGPNSITARIVEVLSIIQ